jgi:hypothetical protein
MEGIFQNLSKEKENIDEILKNINNCKEMIVPLNNDYVQAQK